VRLSQNDEAALSKLAALFIVLQGAMFMELALCCWHVQDWLYWLMRCCTTYYYCT
jgi:hypothetical protein